MLDRGKMERWWRRTISAEKAGVFGGIARAGLAAATLPVEAVVRIRNKFYDYRILAVLKPPVPVLSFGNLTVGGTGKTPAVVWCARYLADCGRKPGIASRGYNPEAEEPGRANDEAALIAEQIPDIPHAWNPDRAAAAAALVKDHGCDVVILDDGFQHRRLHRNVDFLLIDALAPFGYGYMTPRGLLREPASSLRRATCVVITHANLVASDALARVRRRIWEIEEGIKVAEAVHRPTALVTSDGSQLELDALKGKRVYAFCGIGNPYSFFVTLGNLGAEVIGIRSFADHHVYSDGDIDGVMNEARSRGAEFVVTTQKDRVKIGERGGEEPPLAELRVKFELIRGQQTVTSILDFLAGVDEGGAAE
ncbi:MAG: tetraacyldisaccharide 4'-kinase [Planctomycetota bacterium]|jgi:tetraacyldisaccharide 4'-kinase